MNNILLGRITLQGMATAKLWWELNEEQDDPLSDAVDIAQYLGETALIWTPAVKPWGVGAAIRAGGTVATTVAGSTVVSTVIAPVALGYAIGAVVGTAIANEVWGEEGAQDAIDFYTGQADYGAYFDVAGNLQTIYELGIKPAVIDTVETGVSSVKQIIRNVMLKRPKLPVDPFGPSRRPIWWIRA